MTGSSPLPRTTDATVERHGPPVPVMDPPKTLRQTWLRTGEDA